MSESWEEQWRAALSRELSLAEQGPMQRVALEFNDQYIERFVEGYALCPYAREGRKREETRRYVHFQARADFAALLQLFLAIADDETQVVAQVIFPGLQIDAELWIDFCHHITRLGHAKRGGADVLANAALHPRLPYKTTNAYSLIPLFRRAPDPTIQWVRLDRLEKLYEGRAKGSTFVDPADIISLMESPAVKSLYDRVAEANQTTALGLGIEHLEAELAQLHLGAQRTYQSITEARQNEAEQAKNS